ncbi:MAG: DUF669 domain-containing protein [Clostridium beijerinckii]|nr:DUF669 domain-containing protein [Clostridium beijerinckii]
MAKEIWDEFDEKIDVEGLKADAKEAADNGGDFKEIPHGKYEVEVNKMELKKSKNDKPMLSIWFKILAGEFKGSLIFYNQVLSTGFGLHNANEFLRSLDSGIDVEFVNFKQYHEMLLDVYEAINGNLEYALDYQANSKNKDFSTYEIVDVFEK